MIAARQQWALDPNRNRNFLDLTEEQTERLIAQSAARGKAQAEGQAAIWGSPGEMISGFSSGMNKGQARKQDQEAHQRRMELSEEDLQQDRAEKSILDKSDTPGGMTLREQKMRAGLQKGATPQTAAWSTTNQVDEEGRPIMFNRLTGEEKVLGTKTRAKPKEPKEPKLEVIEDVDPSGKPVRKVVTLKEGMTFAPKPAPTGTKSPAEIDFDKLPPEKQKQIDTIAGKVGGYKAASGIVQSGLVEYQNAKTKDDKIRIGKSMIKEMNSLVGSDAVGAEEVKRLASALEFQIANATGEGPMWGRDLKGFERQVYSAIQKMKNSAAISENEIDKLYGRQPTSVAQEPRNPFETKSATTAIAGPAVGPIAPKDPEVMTPAERAEELRRLRGTP